MRVSFSAILLLLCLLSSNYGNAQLIRGTVYDANTRLSIPGVHVVSGNRGVLSDNKGYFYIIPENAGSSLSFSFTGYIRHERKIEIGVGDTLNLNVLLYPDITNINEVVVSAAKGEQKISDLSVSMNLIKPFLLSKEHIINAGEALHKSPGIEIIDGQASIRGGSGYSYGAGSRVLTLIDGLPALSADAGNIKWTTLPIENISRIEVIKGASSVLYGSSALNGVINFISREADTEPVTRVSMLAGVYDNPPDKNWKWWTSPRMIQNVSFNHSVLSGRNSIGIGARILNDNGYRKNNDDRNTRLNFSIKRKGAKNSSLSYGLSIFSSYSVKNDFLLWDNAENGGLIQSEQTAMEYRGLSLSLDPYISFKGKKSGKHKIVSRLMTNLNRLPDNQNNNSDSHSVYAEYNYSYNSWEKISLISGFTHNYSFINSNFYGNHRGLNFALFSQVDLEISDRLGALAGLRIEEYILDGMAELPYPIFRAGFNFDLGNLTFIRASFGQGYRYPSIAEKHAYTTVGAIRIFPNNEIKAEKGWSSELGIRKAISSGQYSGNMDLALFYSRNKDMIEYVFGLYPDPLTEVFITGFRPANIENSNIYGIEYSFDINRSLNQLLCGVSGSYTFVYPLASKLSTGDKPEYLKYRRKHSAKLSTEIKWKQISTALSVYIKSAMLDIDNVFLNELTREAFLPGFYDYWLENNTAKTTVDYNISYRFTSYYTLSFMIRNLGNVEYMGRPGDIQPHRFFSLQLSALF